MYSEDEESEEEDLGDLIQPITEQEQVVELPSLQDPDFAQFVAYLGVEIPEATKNSNNLTSGGGGGSTSTSEGSSSLSSFGSAPSPIKRVESPDGVEQKEKDDGVGNGAGGSSSSSSKHNQSNNSGSNNPSSSSSSNVDNGTNESLLKIVQQAYVAPLPPNWEEYADDQGRIYFYNHVTEISSWAHPSDRTYKELIQVGFWGGREFCSCFGLFWGVVWRGWILIFRRNEQRY